MLGTSARVSAAWCCPSSRWPCCSAQALTVLNVPQAFVAWVMGFGTDRTAVILLFLAIWIVAGMFMETGPNIVVLRPAAVAAGAGGGHAPGALLRLHDHHAGPGLHHPALRPEPVRDVGPDPHAGGHHRLVRALPFALVMVGVAALIGFFPADLTSLPR
jgi:hypothetical protein